MSKRDKFRQPIEMKCDWCHKKKWCRNNAQLEHFKRVYPLGRDYKNSKGELTAASGMTESGKPPDVFILCGTCIPLAKRYNELCWEENQAFLDWFKDFNVD